MSVQVDGYSVWCDAEDCMEWVGQQQTRREARTAAKQAGWERHRDGDFCPFHRRKDPATDRYVDGQGTSHFQTAGGWRMLK